MPRSRCSSASPIPSLAGARAELRSAPTPGRRYRGLRNLALAAAYTHPARLLSLRDLAEAFDLSPSQAYRILRGCRERAGA